MAMAASMMSGVKVEFIEFPAVVTPPASTKTYFLGGAGISLFYITNSRGMLFEQSFLRQFIGQQKYRKKCKD